MSTCILTPRQHSTHKRRTVYHFAAVASGPKHARVVSWYTGWFNALAWTFGAASLSSVLANQILALYELFHPDYAVRQWHLLVVYLAFTWLTVAVVLFANRALPAVGNIGAVLIILGFGVIVVTCAAMSGSSSGAGYASSHFVWRDWVNRTGYESDGFVFLMGMLNGAYAVGTPDLLTHLAEEMHQPRRNIPKAIGIQMGFGFLTAVGFLVAIFYSVHDPARLFDADSSSLFPMVDVFLQATGTKAGATGLIMVMVANGLFMSVGAYLTASRITWTLARDNALPFSSAVARIHPRRENPSGAILVCGGVATAMGFLYLGSSAALSAFFGCFVTLTTLSYLGAILPYLVTSRRHVVSSPGCFRMPRTVFVPVAALACLYIVTFVVIFCFPYSQPVAAAADMNFTCVIVGGIAVLMGVYWFARARRQYKGPEGELLRKIQGFEVLRGEEHGGESEDSTGEKRGARATVT